MYQTILKIPREWKNFLKQEADRRTISLAALIRQIVFEWIEKEKGSAK